MVAQVNNGAGIFSVSVLPKLSLCDGVFHRVAGKQHFKIVFDCLSERIVSDTFVFVYKSQLECLLQAVCQAVLHGLNLIFPLIVIKRKNVVEMHVDTDGNYTIGPATSITTMTKDPLYVGGIPG